MLYLTNIQNIENIPVENLDGTDNISVFCKETDALKIPAINMLLSIPAKVDFIPVTGKDDMLICLGALIANEERATILVPSIPVPKRYEERIIVAKTRKTTTRKSTPKKRKTKAEKSETEPTEKAEAHTQSNEENRRIQKDGTKDLFSAMNKPTEEEETFDDPSAEKLFKLIGIKSEDIGFSWPTQMLMLKINGIVSDSEDEEELETSIKSIRNGTKIWKALKDHLPEARKIANHA